MPGWWSNSDLMYAYIVYSITQNDAHIVEELGQVIQRTGVPVEYWHEHQGLTIAFDKVARSQLFLGVLTASANTKTVLQLYENAKRLGIMAMLLVEKSVNLPSKTSREPNVISFQRFGPVNPIRMVEMKLFRS